MRDAVSVLMAAELLSSTSELCTTAVVHSLSMTLRKYLASRLSTEIMFVYLNKCFI